MAKYHVNPKTGTPSVCRATKKNGCPYEGVSSHYASAEAARIDYESNQEKISHFMWKTQVPQAEGAITLVVYDPLDENVPMPGTKVWSTGAAAPDPVAQKFFNSMDNAPDGALVVVEDGSVFQKNTLYGNQSWALRSKYIPSLRLETDKAYDRSNFGFFIKNFGARLETTPKRFYPNTEYLSGLGRRVSRESIGYSSLSDADLAKIYATAWNEKNHLGETDDFREIEEEVMTRGHTSDFISLNNLERVEPMKNLSLEGIDSHRQPKEPRS